MQDSCMAAMPHCLRESLDIGTEHITGLMEYITKHITDRAPVVNTTQNLNNPIGSVQVMSTNYDRPKLGTCSLASGVLASTWVQNIPTISDQRGSATEQNLDCAVNWIQIMLANHHRPNL